jgi:PP-loop superfamily ATP-utilizing enzyme
MKDSARRISDINHMSAYKSQSMSTSKSASIDHKAHAIHHRTMLHAIHQKTIDTNKLVQENRIFDSCFLCNRAVINGIQSSASGRIRMYNRDSE